MNRVLISALLCSLAALAQDAAPKETSAPAEPAAKTSHPIPVGKPYFASRDTKLYHHGRCKVAKELKQEAQHLEFTWKAEAEQAGFQPCADCMAPRPKAKAKTKAK